jgi:hypothetical protein
LLRLGAWLAFACSTPSATALAEPQTAVSEYSGPVETGRVLRLSQSASGWDVKTGHQVTILTCMAKPWTPPSQGSAAQVQAPVLATILIQRGPDKERVDVGPSEVLRILDLSIRLGQTRDGRCNLEASFSGFSPPPQAAQPDGHICKSALNAHCPACAGESH